MKKKLFTIWIILALGLAYSVFAENVCYSGDTECLDSGYNPLTKLSDNVIWQRSVGRVSGFGSDLDQWGNPIDGLCGHDGYYFLDNKVSIIKVETPYMPEAGSYQLILNYLTGTPGQWDETWAVYCNGKTHHFEDKASNAFPLWRYEAVDCIFDEGINHFYIYSTGWHSVGLENFRIRKVCDDCMDQDDDGSYAIDANCEEGNDCDDLDNTIYPYAPEICDNKDNDCDGQEDEGDVCAPTCEDSTEQFYNGAFENLVTFDSASTDSSTKIIVPKGISIDIATATLTGLPVDITEEVSVDIVLVTDTSGSMGSLGRLEGAVEAGRWLVDHLALNGNSVGLVDYATTTKGSIPLTDDKTALNAEIDSYYASGSTCISCGLFDAKDIAKVGSNDKYIILMTDGQANYCIGYNCDFDEARDEAVAVAHEAWNTYGIRVYTAAFGGGTNEDNLKAIAAAGNGKFFSGNDLLSMYQEIVKDIISSYPTNPTLDIGYNGNIDASYPGVFDFSSTVNFAAELENLIENCNCAGCTSNGDLCVVDMTLTSDTPGKILVDGLFISTYNDCDAYDDWYDTGDRRWIEDGQCAEKEQGLAEYRDYYCGENLCDDYDITDSEWVDTGATRNKQDGLSCDDGYFCSVDDQCLDGVCSPTQLRDCSGNDVLISECYFEPDWIDYTFDYYEFESVCDEDLDICSEVPPNAEELIIHVCSVDQCGAECDENTDLSPTCEDDIIYYDLECLADCTLDYETIDCNDNNDWYDTGDRRWVDDGDCSEKEQGLAEYRDYYCSENACEDYDVTDSQWIDTGEVRAKTDGTSCEDGLYCTINNYCLDGSCIGGELKDCTGNDVLINECYFTPDSNDYTYDYYEFESYCDEDSDECTSPPQDAEIEHICSVDQCGAECDEYSDLSPRCEGDILYYDLDCQEDCTFSYDSINCDDNDGWYDAGDRRWIDDGQCAEKEQGLAEYRDYYCGENGCDDYDITDSQWEDTGETRNEENGVPCEDGFFCTLNSQCLGGVCTASTLRDCSANDVMISECYYNPDGIDYTFDYLEFESYCNEDNDECTQIPQDAQILHICSVDECGAECDQYTDLSPKCLDEVYYYDLDCQDDCTLDYETQDCDELDGWQDSGQRRWVDTDECSEKEQKLVGYRDYSCVSTGCDDMVVVDTQWVDTGEIRPKDDGSPCEDSIYCSVNNYCLGGSCVGGEPRDCSGNDVLISECYFQPDAIDYTYDYYEFESICDEQAQECSNPPQDAEILHVCSVDQCGAECDENSDLGPRCEGDTLYYNLDCQEDCTFSYDTENCDDKDDWYDAGDRKWVDDTQCTEKEQGLAEYRDYYCSENGCEDYDVTDSTWQDTGAIRDKDNGTSCDDGYFCSVDDQCLDGVCSPTQLRDCSGNDVLISECYFQPDSIDYTFDYYSFISECNEDLDECSELSQDAADQILHVCSVDQCGAECDENTDLSPTCVDDTIYYNLACQENCTLSYETLDCNDDNDWYDSGERRWVDETECTEKEQGLAVYRDYYCSENACEDYDVTDSQWEDTGAVRPKEIYTYCGQPRDCLESACHESLPIAIIYTPDGHDMCDGQGSCIEYVCDVENAYCSDNDPNDGIDSIECGAECDQDSDCPATDCDQYDGCFGNDYYDFENVENYCSDCSCEQNTCQEPTIYYDHEACDCQSDDDCDELDDDYCEQDAVLHDEGRCVQGDCVVETSLVDECYLYNNVYCQGDELWEDVATCVDAQCQIDPTQLDDCNSYDTDYCEGDELWHADAYCSEGECTGDITLVEDCDSYDGVYCEGNEIWEADAYCSDNACTADLQQLDDCDSYDAVYCEENDVLAWDSYCEEGSCTGSDSLVDDCDSYDALYCSEDEVWGDDGYCEQGACSVDSLMLDDCNINDNIYCQENDIWEDNGYCSEGFCEIESFVVSPWDPLCSECQNGITEPGEECDDGNNETGDGCDPDCTWGQCLHDVGVRYSYSNSFDTGIAIRPVGGDWIEDPVELIKGVEQYELKYYIDKLIENSTDTINIKVVGDGIVFVDYNYTFAASTDYHFKTVPFNITYVPLGSYSIQLEIEMVGYQDCNWEDNYAQREVQVVQYCGDGVTNGNETCDYADENSSVECRDDCTFCGDGIQNNEEEACDDGNAEPCDDCNNECQLTIEVCDGEDNDCDGAIDEGNFTIMQLESTTAHKEAVFLDGMFVSKSFDWQSISTRKGPIRSGAHVLAFGLKADSWPAGFIASARNIFGEVIFNTQEDGTWLYSTDCDLDLNWTHPDYDDSSWQPMIQVAEYGDLPWLYNVLGWSDPDADWLWVEENASIICVRRNFTVETLLTEVCGEGDCVGLRTCIDAEYGDCSSMYDDCGTCCLCDQDGIETADLEQDYDCSPTICPDSGCGLDDCTSAEYALFPEEVENECSDLKVCTEYICEAECLDEDLSTPSLSFRSSGGMIGHIGDYSDFNLALIDLSSWITKVFYESAVDGVTSLEVTAETSEDERIVLNIRMNLNDATIGCEEVHGVQSGRGTYWKKGEGRQTVQCVAEYWLDRVNNEIDLQGSCGEITFNLQDIDDIEFV